MKTAQVLSVSLGLLTGTALVTAWQAKIPYYLRATKSLSTELKQLKSSLNNFKAQLNKPKDFQPDINEDVQKYKFLVGPHLQAIQKQIKQLKSDK